MRHRAWTWFALSSLIAAHLLLAATRPRYGGTLTVQLASPLVAEQPWIETLYGETLVELNDAAEPEPALAVSWQRELDGKRWRFTLRPKVLYHDGKGLTAATAAASLQESVGKMHAGVVVTGTGMTLVFQAENPIENLPAELSLPRNAILRKGEAGEPVGTGPFRVDKWDAGRQPSFAAFEDYWGGRPFLDSVMFKAGPLPRQISTGAADIWELPISSSRRVLPETMRVWTSPPQELVAVIASGIPAPVREALALSIDRAPIVNVLTQKRGEAAGGILPQTLTGYSFLFPVSADPARGRRLLASTRPEPLTLSYPTDDPLARSIADRIALNARDVGLSIQPATNAAANLRLVRMPLASRDPALALASVAASAGLPPAGNPGSMESLYQAERAIVEDHTIIPLVYLPFVFGVGPRVHNWDQPQRGNGLALHLENVWVSP